MVCIKTTTQQMCNFEVMTQQETKAPFTIDLSEIIPLLTFLQRGGMYLAPMGHGKSEKKHSTFFRVTHSFFSKAVPWGFHFHTKMFYSPLLTVNQLSCHFYTADVIITMTIIDPIAVLSNISLRIVSQKDKKIIKSR